MKTMAMESARSLYRLPSIVQQLPWTFENGRRLAFFEVACPACGETIPADCVRGRLAFETVHTASLEAVGMCLYCGAAAFIRIHLHDDFTVTLFIDDDVHRYVVVQDRPSWTTRVRDLFLRAF